MGLDGPERVCGEYGHIIAANKVCVRAFVSPRDESDRVALETGWLRESSTDELR